MTAGRKAPTPAPVSAVKPPPSPAPPRTGGEGATTEIRCHRCSKFIGESHEPVEFVGVVRRREDVDLVAAPRCSWKCKCGWTNLFQPIERRAA